jgi:hypothetical protein
MTFNNTSITTSVGLAVTGTLSATGTLSGGTSGTAYSFSGSAPATSLTLDSSGNLGVGAVSAGNKLQISNAGANGLEVDPTVASGTESKILSINRSTSAYTPLRYDAASHKFLISGGEQMRLDSSGNLGLGVTPSAWVTYKGFQIADQGSLSAYDTVIQMGANVYYGTNFTYIGTGFATLYQQNAGVHAWRTAASGTAGNAISFTQAMTLDASGNLLVGTTTPSAYSGTTGSTTFTVSGTANPSTAYPSIRLQNSDGSVAANLVVDASNGAFIGTRTNNYFGFHTNNTERMRLDSSGNLLVGKTSSALGTAGIEIFGAGYGQFTANNDASLFANRLGSDGDAVKFYRATSQVGSISVTASLTSYNVTSDYRLKNTIAPMTGALAKVALLKPCTYKWNVNGSDGEGFIAHELAEVVPHAVTGAKDAVDADGKPIHQGIDVSFLVATLTAAIQEQQALITQLTARITALETA